VRKGVSPVAYALSIARASWPVAVAVVSSSLAVSFPRLVAERVPPIPMTATQTTTKASPMHKITSELAAALASVRTYP
jgi:hypothetical protein